MTIPRRIRLSRKKGFNLQQFSMALNGLPAVKVDRSTEFGNPYKIGDTHPYANPDGTDADGVTPMLLDAEDAVALFRLDISTMQLLAFSDKSVKELYIQELRGKNLACWCKLCPRHAATGRPWNEPCSDCEPCHADVWLEIVNG
jgi:hypothetical protein